MTDREFFDLPKIKRLKKDYSLQRGLIFYGLTLMFIILSNLK